MAKKTTSPAQSNSVRVKNLDFPVVGIGASAGGLEALQEFFNNLPSKPGAAFVIIQHLSPDYKSYMNELLARHTSLPIQVVEDGMHVEINNIYLIPPKMNMNIFHGKLYLNQYGDKRTLNLPIDIFLRSLAKDQEKNAISIILSGTGSDGTLGVRAIKELGGMTMSQDDISAKFDGMPRSSISTGMVDYILPPAKLADELISYIKHPFVKQYDTIEEILDKEQNHLVKIISIIRDIEGVDFSLYKPNTIIRRLEKRISINRLNKVEEYVNYLSRNKKEINILYNELLIGVTSFFRDEHYFDKLKTLIVAPIVNNAIGKTEIRVWVPACSTGEEVYSIGMLFQEYMTENDIKKDVKIFATDLDTRSLEYAGTGFYPDNIVSDVSPERLTRFFTKRENGYQVNENLRSMIIFARHDILKDPPFSKIDLISCRNLLIYLKNEVQQKVLSMFHVALRDEGFLFLGNSESLGNLSNGFRVLDGKTKMFRKDKDYRPETNPSYGVSSLYKSRPDLKHLTQGYNKGGSKKGFLEGVFDEVISDLLPPSVIIDDNYNILHTIHNVSQFLHLPVGEVSLNLLKMLSKEVSVIVSSLIRRSEKNKGEVIFDNVKVENQDISLSVSCKRIVSKKNRDIFYLISFKEKEITQLEKNLDKIEKIDINEQYQERIEELEKEVQYKSESLQATVEELETSNEELQSSNEELIASNEELQSTNEELQSVNEELYTVNSEHIRKIDELTELNADFDNLLKNTYIGNLYLDHNLNIRKINDVASQLTDILKTDIGRPMQHLSLTNMYDQFIEDIQFVSDTLQSVEKEIFDKRGHWYLMRILPYRTSDNAVDGIIVTFVNITSLKSSQSQFKDVNDKLDMALRVGEMSWWEWDVQSNMVYTGEGKYAMLGYTKEEIDEGYQGYTKLVHPDDYDECMEAIRLHLEGKRDYYFVEYRIKHKKGHYLWYRDKGGIVERTEDGKPKRMMGIVLNITADKEVQQGYVDTITDAEEKLTEKRYQHELLYATMKEGVVFQVKDGTVVDANPAAEKILGITLNEMQGRTSESLEWASKKIDGSIFPAEEHPSMQALSTGRKIEGVVMGVYNPQKDEHVWIKITAIPMFREGEIEAYKVYTLFNVVELDNK